MGINGGELVVLLVLAFLLIGPERLPELAQQLGRLTRELKKLATGAKEKVKEELGPDIGDLSVFDPRQYDPRRIVREALMDDEEPAEPPRARRRPPARTSTATRGSGATAAGAVAAVATPAGATPAATAAGATASVPAVPATDGAPQPANPAELVARAHAGGPAFPAGDGAAPVELDEPYVVPFDDEAT